MEKKEIGSDKKDSNCLEHKTIFSKEKINLGRQPEVDYLKALGIFLMVSTHVYDNYSQGYLHKIIYYSIDTSPVLPFIR